MPRFSAVRLLSLATLLVPVAFGQNAISARPGTLNYIEGQASIEGKPLSPKSVGHTELASGQYLATADGKAELLLTPGVFLRMDANSTVKMITPDLTHTEVQVVKGRASVEADQLYKDNRILIDENGAQTQLLKNGLYEFNAANNTLRVFDGKADVFSSVTPQPSEKPVLVKGGKQLTLTGEAVRPVNFDRKQTEEADSLYHWGSLRSAYLGEQNVNLASSYAGRSNVASGWAWDGGGYGYTWLPGGYSPFFSPFGYGFYSPGYIYGGGPIYGYGYGGYGYGGYGGGYGYGGTSGSGNRGGIGSGNRGVIQSGTTGRPAPTGGGASHGSASAGGSGGGMSAGGGGFHGGSTGGGSVGGGGGGHR